jgi:hypothetical protein
MEAYRDDGTILIDTVPCRRLVGTWEDSIMVGQQLAAGLASILPFSYDLHLALLIRREVKSDASNSFLAGKCGESSASAKYEVISSEQHVEHRHSLPFQHQMASHPLLPPTS